MLSNSRQLLIPIKRIAAGGPSSALHEGVKHACRKCKHEPKKNWVLNFRMHYKKGILKLTHDQKQISKDKKFTFYYTKHFIVG
jgi:hypothetical protein